MPIPNDLRNLPADGMLPPPGNALFLAAIVESSQDSIISIDMEGKFTSWNAAATQLYGYTAADILGKPLTTLTLPADLQDVLARVEGVKSSERMENFETVRVHQDGHQMWLSVTMSPVRNAAGQTVGISTIARDITARRAAEAAVRQSEEQFRKAIEDAPIPVIMHAEDGQVLAISKTWTELTGYGPDDMANFQAWLNQAYGDGAENVREHMQRLFQGEAAQLHADLIITIRNGAHRRWRFSASAPGFLQDGRRYIVGMALDRTEHEGAETALRESEQRLKLIIENAREYAIFALDLERKVTSWNSGAEAILGYTQQEILGQSADVIFTAEDRAAGAPEEEKRTALTRGKAVDERWHLRSSGQRFWASGVMMRMDDESGKAVGLVKIFRDQTAELLGKRALEKALAETAEARGRVEEAIRAKDHFLAVLSHELRTPLTPILMAVKILKRRTDLPGDVTEALQMIERNVAVESRFVDELLDMTRIANGKLEITRDPVNVHQALQRAVEVTAADFEAKGQTLTVDLTATADTVLGDSVRIAQTGWNLLKNASKFTPDGGRISLRTRNEPGLILIEVQDNGIGISPETLARIFEPFEQGGPQVTKSYGGLGLGLAIAKATIEAHCGELKAASPGAGKGATFTVNLPLKS